MPFGQRNVAVNIYNICKRHFGSRGGGQFENLVFVTMSTRENIRLIARIPLMFHSKFSTYTRLPNDRMLYIWLNIKTTPPRSKSKIGECHASYVWGII